MSVLFTATYPERVRALVLAGVYAKRVWSPDYPWAPTSEQRDREYAVLEREWAEEMDVGVLAPSATDDPLLMRRIATFFRHSASPGAAVGLLRMNTQIDTRAVLATIGVPTLVLQRTGDRDVNVEEGRWISQQIPGAKYVELPGEDHLVWVGDTDTMLDEVETFLPGARRGPEPNRVLATILFTDIVGSTERAAALGDRRWRELLEEHHRLVRAELDNFRGLEIDTAGDGFFARWCPYRGVRDRRRHARRYRNPHRSTRRSARSRRGGPRLTHSQGPRRRLRNRLRRPRRAPVERRSRRAAALRSDEGLTGASRRPPASERVYHRLRPLAPLVASATRVLNASRRLPSPFRRRRASRRRSSQART
jgi:hypothetical protein